MRAPELFDLSGRTALVTGGGRGLGRDIAIGLAEAGADVVVASRKLAACEETAAAIRALGRRGLALEVDMTQPEQVEALVSQSVAAMTRVDILVNCAARTWAAPTLEYPLEGWDRVFDLNVRGLWLLTQGMARHMKERGGGSIIHISSISAWRGAPDSEQPVVAYMASKGALHSLTRDLAVKLAPDGIRVNCIAPGPFLTDMMNHIRHDPERLAEYVKAIPLGRCGGADDLKGAVVFLASPAAAYTTGAILVVDGGSLSR